MEKKSHQKKREEKAKAVQEIITKAKAIYDLTEFVDPRELGDALRFLQREMDNCHPILF